MPLQTPTLRTPRLLLRPFADTDAEAIYALQSNARVLRYWDSPPWKDRARAQAFLSDCREMERHGTGTRFAIETNGDGAFIGWCSMFGWNPTYRSLGIGYCLDEPAWGRGYATEAVRAMLDWAYQALDLNRVEAELDTRNAASARVLEKLGFVREGLRREDCIVDGEVSDSWIYGLLARDRRAPSPPDLPPSPLPGLTVVALAAGSEPLLQQFFEANPAYFLSVTGEPPGPNDAHDEIHDELPAGWPFTRRLVLGYRTESGRLAAMANIVTDLLAPTVWHISTFVVATERHGSGDAVRIYGSLEAWAIEHGARWIRLGVVAGSERAERFWASRGFRPLRERVDVPFGTHTRTVRVLVKPLSGGTVAEYLALVQRDHPDAD